MPPGDWAELPAGDRAELPAFLDPGLPLHERADDLLRRLTTAEKVAMLHQHSPGVSRLGIAPFHTGTEALHGAAWLGPATVFPQAVGLGASWDADLVQAVGTAVAEEVRGMHRRDPAVSLNVWAPVVNLLRDPRWGRNEEGYSEDPLLTARTAIAYCRGLSGDHPVYLRTAPLLKHFLAYNNETDRSTTSSALRPRVLHEYDLPPFHAPIAAGVAVGVMPSYNLVNGRPCHVSPYLERELRRWPAGERAGDELVVCSDAEAPSNLVDAEHHFADHPAGHAAALRAGVDSFTDHGEDSSVTIGRITEALERGLLTVADVETGRAVADVLLGGQDPGGRLPQTWYSSLADLPGLLEYDIIKARRTYLYFEGTPLFPFGHGLSYATFSYARLRLDAAEARDGDTVTAAVEVTNTGTRDGTEVIQLYTRALAPRGPRPRRALAGFARVTLRPGESSMVEIPLPVSSLAFWDVATHRMTVDPGNYEVMAGSSSDAIRQSTLLTIRGRRPRPRQFGAAIAAADFDDYDQVTLVDATPEDGDAVTPASGDGPGWILFRAVSLAESGSDELAVTAWVAREEPGEASLDLWCDHPADGRFLGSVAVPCTGGRYAWTEISAGLAPATGVRDLYVVLRGRQRLASVRLRGVTGGSEP